MTAKPEIRIPKPADPFAAQIAARLAAKRSGVIVPAKPETAPVASLGPMPSWLKRMVLPHAIRQVAGWVRERTDA